MSQSFKPKEYAVVATEREASDLLTKAGEKARVIAGGTGIYEVASRGLFSDVELLVDISKLGLSYIRVDETRQTLSIGACTTMTSILEAFASRNIPEVRALLDALRAIQPLQVKNVATVGGAICIALPFFDLPVALMALDSDVVIAPDDRIVKLNEFIRGYFAVDLRPGEFVREISISLSSESEPVGSSFEKFALTGDDWAMINFASWLKIDETCNAIAEARLCFGGGVGERPVRTREAELSLIGVKASDEQAVRKALDANIEEKLETISDLKASSKYRKHLAKVLAGRSIVRSALVAKERGG